MRVIAGEARSVPLMTPKGMTTRPTTDRVKETLFNIIQNDLDGAYFLDLFAGSGQMGIEALSRGAEGAVFVDRDRSAEEAIKKNLLKTKLSDRALVRSEDVFSFLTTYRPDHGADLIFMDPPYDARIEYDLLRTLSTSPFLKPSTLLIIETPRGRDLVEAGGYGFFVDRVKTYKTNQHVFLRQKEKK